MHNVKTFVTQYNDNGQCIIKNYKNNLNTLLHKHKKEIIYNLLPEQLPEQLPQHYKFGIGIIV